MAQELTQEQIQELKQIQALKLSQQQLMTVKLIAMPVDELGQDIEKEIISNPALEENHDEDTENFNQNDLDTGGSDYNEGEGQEEEFNVNEKEEHEDELNKALENMESDDERQDDGLGSYFNEDYKEVERGNQQSFFDNLNEQMGELELSETEHQVMEYLIGSLDDDGLLRIDTDIVAEKLYIEEYIDVTKDDVEKVLKKLQTFDPAGVGARDLQECLLLQIDRMDDGDTKTLLNEIITNYFEEFRKNHWNKIQNGLNLTEEKTDYIKSTIKRRLTPKPGYSLGESIGVSLNQVTPDFIVYITEDNRVTFELNNGRLPQLCIADTFEMMAESYKDTDDTHLNREDKEAKKYVNDCVDKGKMYIEAIRQRNRTMEATMKAIIKRQKKYFIEGEETELKPMKLEDIANDTGFDVSTISRVSKDKYAQTPWGIILLKNLFNNGYVNEEGEEMSVKRVKQALKEIIDAEDKKKPFSDDALVNEMKKKGYPIARRTIAKYRDQLKIPVARMRKK